MNKSILIFLVFQLFTFSNGFSHEIIHAEITYIGNEGFMIFNSNNKILIDALYDNTGGGNGIVNIDSSLSNRIMNNQEPFINSDLYFVTHGNADHFNQSMVSNYLVNNPQSIMVADSTLTKPMKSTFQNQIFTVTPARYHSVDTILNDIPFSVYNLKHNSQVKIYNVGYWMNIGGLKIFHGGDNILEDSTEYLNTNLFDKRIDIAFLNHNGFLKSSVNSEFIKNHMKPRYIVLMHIPDNLLSSVKEKVSKLDGSYPPVFVFSASMEKIMVTDTAFISNHMPVKKGNIEDALINAGSAISIDIPALFEESDTNDSLSYSMIGLPTGLYFNKEDMTITGSTQLTGNFNVKVTATDKSFCSNSLSFKITVTKPTNVSSNKTNSFNIFSNPATNYIWLNRPLSSDLKIQIYDIHGKLLLEKSHLTNQIDISNLKRGIYIVKLFDTKEVITSKLIKE
jgi:L-ascorbate metabolism protein UlaG (beta-lactamase superfamily)